MSEVKIVHRQPTVEEYSRLRDVVGWGNPDEQATRESIKNALFSVCVEKDDRIIGLGRVVGDGGLYFYVQDIIVLPEHRGKGYAGIIMDEVMKYINSKVGKGGYIGLFAAKGVEGLYKKYGFVERPNEQFGSGMFILK